MRKTTPASHQLKWKRNRVKEREKKEEG